MVMPLVPPPAQVVPLHEMTNSQQHSGKSSGLVESSTMPSASSKSHSHAFSQQQGNTVVLPPQLGPSGSTVVRRSSRLSSKKSRSQRCTLAASQLAEAAHELTLALSASAQHTSSHGGPSSGDTWPRYRPPHQLLSSVLPAFYRNHGHELQQIYSKQGALVQQQQTHQQHLLPTNYNELNYLTNIHQPRRKQRKALGANLNDIFQHKTSANNSPVEQASTSGSFKQTHLTPLSNEANVSMRRSSPRSSEQTHPEMLSPNDHGVVGIPFEHHQMVYQHQHQNVSFH